MMNKAENEFSVENRILSSVKTSYFSSKLWHGKNAVAISQGVPQWYKGRVYKALAPSWELVKIKDVAEYTRRYKKEVLSKLDPKQVYKHLGEDAILLCWEKPGEFCHRRLVAEWLEEALGIKVPELGYEIEQISLF
jgi:hypothetical protein